MEEHFCTCGDRQCPRHPANHNNGCDRCIRDNLANRRMPSCFFKLVHNDLSGQTDFSMGGFVDFYRDHT
ncbi:MAG: hypothetical protein GXY32_09960 [Ruminococcaceae bacterium]|nr:hypothetical protein [Oscillospiraceae bacterium]